MSIAERDTPKRPYPPATKVVKDGSRYGATYIPNQPSAMTPKEIALLGLVVSILIVGVALLLSNSSSSETAKKFNEFGSWYLVAASVIAGAVGVAGLSKKKS